MADQRKLASLYLSQVNDRNQIELYQQTIIQDLSSAQQQLRDLKFEYEICNKQTTLLATI
jgi:hypothetical protein